jgi:prepilin-type N-terminal cleavage/methylation domain-containing protein
MTKQRSQSGVRRAAFTLIETLTVLALSAILLTAVLQIYHQVRSSTSRLTGHLNENRLAREILQKIGEDIDRLAAPGFDATIQFRNKYDNGYSSAQLTLENKYYGKGTPPKAEVYDRIVWQTTYDPFFQTLILYRMHDGLNVEDKVIESGSDVSPSAGLFIPVADGLTHFELSSLQGENLAMSWTSETLPTAVRIGVSFSPLEELSDGRIGVPEEKIIYRTVAVDRTRFIPYQFIKRKLDTSALEESDPNSTDPNDTTLTDTTKESASETGNVRK